MDIFCLFSTFLRQLPETSFLIILPLVVFTLLFSFFQIDFHLHEMVTVLTAWWSGILYLRTNTGLVSCFYITICCHDNLIKMARYFKPKLLNSWHSLNLGCKSLYHCTKTLSVHVILIKFFFLYNEVHFRVHDVVIF